MSKIDGPRRIDGPPKVSALVYDGLCTFEFGICAEVFGLQRPELGGSLYDFKSVSPERRAMRAAGGLEVMAAGTKHDLETADVVVVPGWSGKDSVVPDGVCHSIRKARDAGAILLSICSGIYVLAAAGVLSNRRATTHWRYVDDLKSKYPDVSIEPNALYVDTGDIITSAGSTAGLDSCLHVVRRDYGATVTNMVARRLVMHAYRQGGQAQFIEPSPPKITGSSRLATLMDEIRSKLTEQHTISSMAASIGMSPRTFQRRFSATADIPAMQWLTRERVMQSCILLETTSMDVGSVAQSVGLANAEALRYHFRQTLDLSPTEYRKRFSEAERQADTPSMNSS